jgi:hypothetical protein
MNFNWVKARSECSLVPVFAALREVVDSDVKEVNELNRPRLRFTLNPEAGSASKFVVIRQQDMSGFFQAFTVVFELKDDAIVVTARDQTGNGKPLFSAKPSLKPDGQCMLDIDGEPCFLWQVSRKALEALFFGE